MWHLENKLERKKFRRSPLVSVACEIRFAEISDIESDLNKISAFYKQISEKYPKATREHTRQLQIRQGSENEQPQIEAVEFQSSVFATESGDQMIVLSPWSFAVREQKHVGRDRLFASVEDGFRRVTEIFAPNIQLERIGLRYTNAIDAVRISGDLGRDVEYDDLISSDFLRMPMHGTAGSRPTSFQVECNDDFTAGSGSMSLRYGLINAALSMYQSKIVRHFRLDIDRYINKDSMSGFRIDQIKPTMEGFAENAYEVFCEASKPALLEWMEEQ